MDELHADAPALLFAGMALTMTIPMVALMRYRGHAWRPCWEMSASMILPAVAAIGLLWAEVGSVGVLMTLEHVAMLPAMLVAMLLRPEEYRGHCHAPA
jgi:hypothetical protein